MKRILIATLATVGLAAAAHANDHDAGADKAKAATEATTTDAAKSTDAAPAADAKGTTVTPGEAGPTEAVSKEVPTMSTDKEGTRPATEAVGDEVPQMEPKSE